MEVVAEVHDNPRRTSEMSMKGSTNCTGTENAWEDAGTNSAREGKYEQDFTETWDLIIIMRYKTLSKRLNQDVLEASFCILYLTYRL